MEDGSAGDDYQAVLRARRWGHLTPAQMAWHVCLEQCFWQRQIGRATETFGHALADLVFAGNPAPTNRQIIARARQEFRTLYREHLSPAADDTDLGLLSTRTCGRARQRLEQLGLLEHGQPRVLPTPLPELAPPASAL